jgi:hypothetical protein
MRLLCLLLSLFAAVTAQAQITATGTILDDDAPVADCYNLSAGELAQVPWQSASGSWGPAVSFTTHSAPVTSGDPVYVSNTAEFNAAALTPGQVIIFDADINEDEILGVGADNLDIVIPPGIEVGLFINSGGVRSNVRIRGETPCEHSGGRAGQLRLGGTNIIYDGFDTNSSGDFGPGSEAERWSCIRNDGSAGHTMAIVNMRGLCAYQGMNFGGVGMQIFCRNSHFLAGARADTGSTGQWAYRVAGGRHYHVGCDWRTDRFAAMRPHTVDPSTGELWWSLDSTYVNYAEGRVFWIWHGLNGNPGQGEGFVLINPRVAAHGTAACGGSTNTHLSKNNTHDTGADVPYSRIYSMDIYSSGDVTASQAGLNTEAAYSADGDWDDGNNNIIAWTSDLSWDADPGDPRAIVMPDGFALEIGEVSLGGCAPPGFM